jgi:hypothetical protein
MAPHVAAALPNFRAGRDTDHEFAVWERRAAVVKKRVATTGLPLAIGSEGGAAQRDYIVALQDPISRNASVRVRYSEADAHVGVAGYILVDDREQELLPMINHPIGGEVYTRDICDAGARANE